MRPLVQRREPLLSRKRIGAHRRAARLADEVGGGQRHVLKHELGGGGRAHPALVLEPLPQAEAGHAALDVKEGDGLGRLHLRPGRARVDEVPVAQLRVRDRAVGDPHLGSVEQPAPVRLLLCPRAHPQHVRPRLRLRHAHAADRFARARGREPGGLLLGGAVAREVVDEELRVGQVREAEGRVRRRELLVHDAGRRRVHARAAVLGVDGHAEQPELAGAAKERVVEPLRPVELERLRLHLVPHERGAQLAERIVLRGRVEEGALRLGVVGDADRRRRARARQDRAAGEPAGGRGS
mmetsp:Transcript_22029/g.73071  ORF Transcript_22029/g.73071 Transcript_22029/m.73071 type:complete len:295 (-) Transcript_22029:55-939(-)